jgi:hypothetical protein
MQDHDYIVLDGGSAGWALLARLVEAGTSVLRLKGLGANHPYTHIPARFNLGRGSSRKWMYKTEAESCLNRSEVCIPQSHSLGCGGSANGMIYIGGTELYQTNTNTNNSQHASLMKRYLRVVCRPPIIESHDLRACSAPAVQRIESDRYPKRLAGASSKQVFHCGTE